MKRPAENQEPQTESEETTSIANNIVNGNASSDAAQVAKQDGGDKDGQEPAAEVKLTKKQKRDLNKPTMLPSVGLDQEVDLKVSCKDCKKEFVLSAKEQQVFRYRGYAHVPSRCPPCKKKKAARDRKNDNRKNRKNICFAFKQGKCRRAETCRFKHGDEQENGITTGSNAGRLGIAMPMDMTLEAPPEGCCFDFWRTDDCSRGYNCKFEHRRGVRTPATFSEGAAFGATVAHQAPVHDVGEPPMGVCFDFWKTQHCSRGDNCKFEHRSAPPPPVASGVVAGSQQQVIGDPPMGVCFDFWKTGRCERNDNCRFEHKRGEPVAAAVVAPSVVAASSIIADVGEPPKGVCFDFFKTGQCSRDDNCKFEHRRPPPPVAVAAPVAMSAPLAATSVTIGDPPKGVCFDFFKTGECSRDDKCKFEHKRPTVVAPSVAVAVSASGASSTEDPPKGVCFDFFKTMQCSRGDNCKFKHERA